MPGTVNRLKEPKNKKISMSISLLVSIIRTSPSDQARKEALELLVLEYKRLKEKARKRHRSYPTV